MGKSYTSCRIFRDYTVKTKQVQAIVDAVEEVVEKEGFKVRSIEGKDGGKWILMDLNDVIVHVFYYADREFYNLEKLWSDAPIVNIVSEN